MKKLAKPLDGILINKFGIFIHLNFARTLSWASDEQVKNGEVNGIRRVHHLFSTTVSEYTDGMTIYGLIIGPFKIIFGKLK